MMNRQHLVAILYVLLVVTSSSAGLVIDHGQNKVSWVGDGYGWAYFVDTGNWSWVNVVDLITYQWDFDELTKAFSNQTTGETWQYDEIYDVWVNSQNGIYDIITESTYNNQVWRFDNMTEKWFMVTRVLDESEYLFDTVSAASWDYDTDTASWQYHRTVSGTPIVPITGTWTFDPVNLVWQLEQDGGGIWHYTGDFADGQWLNVSTADAWLFQNSTDTETQWVIVGDNPGSPYDFREWTLDVTSGLWSSALVGLPALEVFEKNWRYNATTLLWYDVLQPTTTKDIMPLFPPTPFAHFKAVVEGSVNSMLSDGVMVGSSNGADAGFLSDGEGAIFTDGLFVFQDFTKMTFTQVVTISGDVELRVEEDAVLTIGDGVDGHSVIITPSAGATEAQLIFNVLAGKTLEVELLSDCYFKARADLSLYISFRGKGQTVFRMPSGRTISFGPASDSSSAYGVNVQILMDLAESDVADGIHQVVFEPWSYAVDEEFNPRIDKTMWIRFGRSSSLRFFSYNEAGIDGSDSGFGTFAFDVCHAGTGRMILDLVAGQTPGDRYDAGINIWGSLIVGSGDDGAVTNADLRTGTKPHKRAGVAAFMSIVDDLAFDSLINDPEHPSEDDAALWIARGADDRRGLVILNRNCSYPQLASNLAGATTLQTSQWAITQKNGSGYQPGFILGDNGQIRIAHNLFLDYVAGSSNRAVSPTQLAGSGATTAMVKKHNPSAFIVDHVGFYNASASPAIWDMNYSGGLSATIVLEGSAGVFFRCGASAQTGALLNAITVAHNGGESLDATIGNGLYDGVFCPVLDATGSQSVHESIGVFRDGNPIIEGQCLDGEHALDIEGECSIVSVLGKFGFAPNGYINIPSISIDHTGRERGEVSV